MTEIQMPPMDARRGHEARRNTVTALLVEKAERRVGERLGYILYAVDEFKDHAGPHIDDHLRGFEGVDAEVPFGPVIDGLISAAGQALFPHAEFAKIAFEACTKVFAEGLGHAFEAAREPKPTAHARLHESVRALSTAARQREVAAMEEAKRHVPAAVAAAMAQVPDVSDDPGWIEDICTWMGFPEPDQHATAAPVRQWLEYEFSGVLARVQAEVEREHGVAGWDDNDLDPDQWERDAKEDERARYEREGEDAWEDAYKME